MPGVLLLAGSGRIDRDGDARRVRLGIHRQLAEALAGAGIASLRYDRAGVDDASAALEAPRSQPGIDPDAVVLFGHHRGGAPRRRPARAGGAGRGGGAAVPVGATGAGAPAVAGHPDRPNAAGAGAARAPLLRTDLVAKVAAKHARLEPTATDVARVGGSG